MTSFQNTYLRFLSSPSEAALAGSAALHYITSGSSLATPDEIVKYLNRETKLLKKRSEKVLSSVETQDALVLEVETEIEFVSSGGNYLPQLDDNFLADQQVVFPIVHFVSFEAGKIKQARLFWDQATLLKQVDVIGRNGRNWPIKDGREQCQMISRSVAAVGSASSVSKFDAVVASANGRRHDISAASSSTGESPRRGRAGRTSSNAMRDPHASLSLFEAAGNDEEEHPRPIAPRSNSEFRPPSRDLHAIIGPDEDGVSKPLPPKARSSFSRGQTFTVGEEPEESPSEPVLPPKARSSFSKHQTFTLGEEAPAPEPKPAAKATNAKKNGPSWNFEDFTTPEKVPVRPRRDDVRNFTWTDEEPEQDTPVKNKKTALRKDDVRNFSIRDDETPQPKKPVDSAGNAMHNRNFGDRFEISDKSPANSTQKKKKQADDDNFYGDDDYDFFAGMGREVQTAGIRISGNGQGNRTGTEQTIGGTHAKDQRNFASRNKNNGASEGFWDF